MREKVIAPGLILQHGADGYWLRFEAHGASGMLHESAMNMPELKEAFAGWARAQMKDVADFPENQDLRPPEGWR